ncbi:MAG: Fis family transcriptional regulator [Acidobacteriota bacterium]
MALAVFSQEWAEEWRERINSSRGFRRAGARWQDTVAFVMTAGESEATGSERTVFLDLANGECRAARAARPADLAGASFVAVSDPATWRAVLTGELDLVMAIMRGKFSLRRGTLAALLPHASAANELLDTAQLVETKF